MAVGEIPLLKGREDLPDEERRLWRSLVRVESVSMVQGSNFYATVQIVGRHLDKGPRYFYH